MNVLIGCEESATVRVEMTMRGHNAWSCDLKPSRIPRQHIIGNIFDHLDGCYVGYGLSPQPWDLLIVHPDCTYLTNSAAWAYKDPDFERYPGRGYHMKLSPGTLTGSARRAARMDAIATVRGLAGCGIPKICVENPVGALSSAWRKPDQIIQPYEFGDDASKATCLWLLGLPKLMIDPLKRCPGRWVTNPSNGKLVERWGNQTDSGQNRLTPSPERAATRAVTYFGIAEAMAEQWGSLIPSLELQAEGSAASG